MNWIRRLGSARGVRLLPIWATPMVYVVVFAALSFLLPRLEHAYLGFVAHGVSVSSAQAFLSAVSSGMLALIGIVFTIAFVMVQFSAVAYSPRLVAILVDDPILFHTLGIFFATFTYSLATLLWTDRLGSGTVPLLSSSIVIFLLFASLMAFARLIHTVTELQIQNVLRGVGEVGREVISTMFRPLAGGADLVAKRDDEAATPGPVRQTLAHAGEPRVITRFDIPELVRLAEGADGVVVLDCAVGDTVLDGSILLRVHESRSPIDETALLNTIELGRRRTSEQDPKYPLRLLVDIAIRALSPAVNDPTTAVQALDQIEDLLRRIGRSDIDVGRVRDAQGRVRVAFPVPTWQEYLSLAFDEIRQYGASSIQVLRRLRSALVDLEAWVATESRREDARQYRNHLDLGVDRSNFDAQDRVMALQQDRQGLGLTREQS